jgi:hypothetical protein
MGGLLSDIYLPPSTLVKKSAHNKNKYMNIGEKKGVSL